MSDPPETRNSRRDFIWRVLMGIALVSSAVLLVLAIDIVLVIFGGILFAVFLRALAMPLAQRSWLSETAAVSTVLVLMVALLVISGFAVAPGVMEQFGEVRDAVPEMIEETQIFLERIGLGGQMDGEVNDVTDDLVAAFLGLLGGITTFTALLLTFLFVGIFLAYKPRMYLDGFIALVPVDFRPKLRELQGSIGYTIRWWLIGRAIAMVLVGVSTWLLLTILGAPLALLVGILTGFLTFIPYLGPVLGMIPVTLAGVLEDPTIGLYALGLYFVIENIEGYVLDPLIQEQMVYLPPALTIGVQMIMGFVIGPLGIALATPLAAIGLVVTQKTYLQRSEVKE